MRNRKRVGVLIRTFSRKPEGVPSTVEKVIKTIEALLRYTTQNWLVTDILVVIPANKEYKDSDCGQLEPALTQAWLKLAMSIDESALRTNVTIVEDFQGDLFVGVQNFAGALLMARSCDVMVTLAPSAFQAGWFDFATADAMMEAHDSGAKVMAVAIPEDGIDEFVARGTAGGPITGWDLPALDDVDVGGFDPAAAQPKIGEENPNAGCEEIHPIVHLVRKHGACYAPILPRNMAAEKRVLEGEDLERHLKQIRTKTDRQLAHAKSLGVEDLEFFAAGVIPEYRVHLVE